MWYFKEIYNSTFLGWVVFSVQWENLQNSFYLETELMQTQLYFVDDEIFDANTKRLVDYKILIQI